MARLLIMEDDVVLGFQLQQDLTIEGHEVEVRYTASDAITELLSQPYDLLISDIIIRDGDRTISDGGIKLFGWVRGSPAMRYLPIIAITGTHKSRGMSYILNTAEQVGANASLTKPFDLGELIALIDRFLESNPNLNAPADATPNAHA